jgi:hypothetical protein
MGSAKEVINNSTALTSEVSEEQEANSSCDSEFSTVVG